MEGGTGLPSASPPRMGALTQGSPPSEPPHGPDPAPRVPGGVDVRVCKAKAKELSGDDAVGDTEVGQGIAPKGGGHDKPQENDWSGGGGGVKATLLQLLFQNKPLLLHRDPLPSAPPPYAAEPWHAEGSGRVLAGGSPLLLLSLLLISMERSRTRPWVTGRVRQASSRHRRQTAPSFIPGTLWSR